MKRNFNCTSHVISRGVNGLECTRILLPQKQSKLNNSTIHLPSNVILSPVDSVRNLGVIVDTNLSLAQHISAVSKSCSLNIRDIRRIRNTFD